MQSVVDPLNGLRGIGRYTSLNFTLPSEANLSTDYLFLPTIHIENFWMKYGIQILLLLYGTLLELHCK